jgi:hypothetical protein
MCRNIKEGILNIRTEVFVLYDIVDINEAEKTVLTNK